MKEDFKIVLRSIRPKTSEEQKQAEYRLLKVFEILLEEDFKKK